MKAKLYGAVLILSAVATTQVYAEGTGNFELGVRANGFVSDGVPSNDMLGAGLVGRFKIKPNTYIGVGVDFSDFDFERPPKIVGITQSKSVKTLDGAASSTLFSAWYEKRSDLSRQNWQWYWTAGAGYNDVTVDDLSGPVEGGGTFNIKTDTGSEFVLLGSLGVAREFGSGIVLDGSIGVRQHFADWTVTDVNSGATGIVDDYTAFGLMIGITKRF